MQAASSFQNHLTDDIWMHFIYLLILFKKFSIQFSFETPVDQQLIKTSKWVLK